MSNPAQSFSDADYKANPCKCLDTLAGCVWLCGENPICSCHKGNDFFCTECGHEADCHTVVRVQL